MSRRMVLGCADPDIVRRVRSVAAELGDDLARVTATSAETLDAVAATSPDVLIVSDSLGPLPVLDLIRQVSRQAPFTGVLLLSATADHEVFRVAMEAGARSIAPLTFTVDDLGQRLENAASWSRIIRAHVSDEAARAVGTGHVVTLAGSKGGVGATTLAVHVALDAAKAGRRVCLIDLDLQCGDVASLLDITHRRDVVDLVAVAGEVSGQSLDEALYRHVSGLHVLLAPREGERGEDVTEQVSRAILGAVKSRFDLAVVDVGSVLTPAGAAAVEIADVAAVVATPDVLSARSARRLVQLWERLQLRRESDVVVILNRVSRNVEVQPELAGRLLKLAVLDATVPASFRGLEPAANTGDPTRLSDRELRRAVVRLSEALGARPPAKGRSAPAPAPPAPPVPPAPPAPSTPRDGGQTVVEFMGMLPILLVFCLALFQGALIGFSHVAAGHAADRGARTAVSPLATDDDVRAAVTDALPGAWRGDVTVTVDRSGIDGPVSVTVRTPALFPMVGDLFGSALEVGGSSQMHYEGGGA